MNNGNDLGSIPIDYSMNMIETYDNMKMVLEKIEYSQHNWKICGDLKMITILLGMQGGCTKYLCCICL